VDLVADLYRKMHQYEKARQLYSRALETWPNSNYSLESQKGYILCCIALDDGPGVQSAVDELIARFGNSDQLSESLGEIRNEYIKLGLYEEADWISDKAVEANTGQGDEERARIEKMATGIMALIDGGDDANAWAGVVELQERYRGNAALPGNLVRVALRFFHVEAYVKARQLCESISSEYPNAQFSGKEVIPYVIGRSYELLEDYEGAIDFYKDLLKNNRRSRYAQRAPYRIGLLYRESGKYEDALYWLGQQRLMFDEPLSAERSLFEEGAVYYHDLKDYRAAVGVFEQYLGEYYGKAHTWPSYCLMARSYEKLGDTQKAVSVLERALAEFEGTERQEQIEEELQRIREGDVRLAG